MTKSEAADLAILLAERAKARTAGKLGALADIPVNDLSAGLASPGLDATAILLLAQGWRRGKAPGIWLDGSGNAWSEAVALQQELSEFGDAIALGLMGMGQ